MKLRNLLTVMVSAVVLTSCSKDDVQRDCCQPDLPKEIIKDSISTGSKYGVNIGDPIEKVYADFQSFADDNDHENITVNRAAFSQLEDIEQLLPLYSSLALNSVIFTFKNDKVASIQLTSGTGIDEWPAGYSTTIKVNDAVEDIYSKLVTISKRVNYSHLFQKIYLNNKALNKPIDESLKLSNTWSFRYQIDNTTYEYVEFRFTNEKLASIYSQIEKY